MSVPVRFAAGWDLAVLPWFERRPDGRLARIDDEGPAVDCHTHLAMALGGAGRALRADRTGGCSHYLPMDLPLDLDIYVNRNIPPAGLARMKRDLSLGALWPGAPCVTHSPGNLLAEMAPLGVVASVLLPVDAPWPNRRAAEFLDVARRRPGLLSFGSVHPFAPDPARRLDDQLALGARGVKLHPAVQCFPPDHDRAKAVYDLCAERRLPVLWHCGPVGIEPRLGRAMCQVKHYWRAVAERPGATFVLGHSGALQMLQALDLCKSYDNVWLELSCQSVSNVRRILDEAPPDRIVLGSDWPWYHLAVPLAKLFIATEDLPPRRRRAVRRRVLRDNAIALLGLTDAELAASSAVAATAAPATPTTGA